MSKFILTALLAIFVFIQVFMTCTNAASGTSDSISHHDQPEPNSPSSFEDALIYPKQAISPYHINERPSNAFVKPLSQKIPKITLKIGKIRAEEAWKRFRYQELPSQSTKKQKNSNYDSDGRSPTTKILRHSLSGKLKKHDKFEKAMKSMKKFTKTFKSPEERLKIKEENIYAKQYPVKSTTDKEISREFSRKIRAKQMIRDRKLHLSALTIKRKRE